MLRIDDHTLTSGKFAKVDAMPGPAKPKLDPPMEKALPLQSFTDTCFDQQVGGSLLQNARADALFDAFAARGFQNYGLDAVKMQQVREHQASRAGSHNSDLCAYFHEVMGLETDSTALVSWR